MKVFPFRAPYRLVCIHTVLVLFFMFAWTRRWFLSAQSFECAYAPLFFISGPVVHTLAHMLTHWTEPFIAPPFRVPLCWNVIPGATCLILGGLQWWLLEWTWMKTLGKEAPWIFRADAPPAITNLNLLARPGEAE